MSHRVIQVEERVPLLMNIPLSLQHLFAMFGATVLVPFLFKLNPNTCLFMNGVGTLLYIFLTKGKIPSYLGSSFAFISPVLLIMASHPYSDAQSGFIVFGLLFIAFAVFEFMKGFSSSDRNEFYQGVFYGILSVVTGVAVLVMFLMVKYEYDENGFIYTNPLGKKREISYSEIFGLMRTNKNTLRLDLNDGSFISVSTSTKAAKEFAAVIEAAYAQNTQQNRQMPMY